MINVLGRLEAGLRFWATRRNATFSDLKASVKEIKEPSGGGTLALDSDSLDSRDSVRSRREMLRQVDQTLRDSHNHRAYVISFVLPQYSKPWDCVDARPCYFLKDWWK